MPHRYRIAISSIVLLCLNVTVSAAGFQAGSIQNAGRGTMVYRLYVPDNLDPDKHYPMVIFLHGKGKKGSDNKQQINTPGARVWTKPGNQSTHACFVLAPQCPKEMGWQHPEGSEPYLNVLDIISKIEKEHPIDKQRLYITGQSGGGGGVLRIIEEQPKQFAAAIIICPGGKHTEEAMVEVAKKIHTMPLWFFHGKIDQIIPVEHTRLWIKTLKAAGGNPSYTEYPRQKHNSWERAYLEPKLPGWLFAQKLTKTDL